MPKTLNKDGTPRKIGSGKTKGAGCFSSTTWSELRNFISDDAQIPVSRVWLRNLGALKKDQAAQKAKIPPSSSPKILSQPSKPEGNLKKSVKPAAGPQKVEAPQEEQEYEPPPLFAGNQNSFRQY